MRARHDARDLKGEGADGREEEGDEEEGRQENEVADFSPQGNRAGETRRVTMEASLDAAVEGMRVKGEENVTWSVVAELAFIRSLGKYSAAVRNQGFTRVRLLEGYRQSLVGRTDGKYTAGQLAMLRECCDSEIRNEKNGMYGPRR